VALAHDDDGLALHVAMAATVNPMLAALEPFVVPASRVEETFAIARN
jgi:hypothetical protein